MNTMLMNSYLSLNASSRYRIVFLSWSLHVLDKSRMREKSKKSFDLVLNWDRVYLQQIWTCAAVKTAVESHTWVLSLEVLHIGCLVSVVTSSMKLGCHIQNSWVFFCGKTVWFSSVQLLYQVYFEYYYYFFFLRMMLSILILVWNVAILV